MKLLHLLRSLTIIKCNSPVPRTFSQLAGEIQSKTSAKYNVKRLDHGDSLFWYGKMKLLSCKIIIV